jgi:hypothetical protein
VVTVACLVCRSLWKTLGIHAANAQALAHSDTQPVSVGDIPEYGSIGSSNRVSAMGNASSNASVVVVVVAMTHVVVPEQESVTYIA